MNFSTAKWKLWVNNVSTKPWQAKSKHLTKNLMRISTIVIFLVAASIQVLSAGRLKSQDLKTEKVKISLNNENLQSAIAQIEKQTDFIFYYRKSDILELGNFRMPLAQRTIENTMNELLQSSFLTIRQINGHILIEKNGQQLPYEISGRIVNPDYSPVAFASINVLKLPEAKPISITQTGSDGQFKFNVSEKGNYMVKISALGIDTVTLNLHLENIRIIQVPDITATIRATTLKEVVVTAQKPQIELKNNMLVYNINNSAAGSSALEVLRKVPGIIVDGNNNILLKGDSHVKVMINNKMLEVSQAELNTILQSKTAMEIDNIQVMTNPSAKYDAAGSAGIININLKKVKRDSFNGTLSTSFIYGKTPKYNNALTLNYQKSKLSLYTTLSAINNVNERTIKSTRNIEGNYFNDQSRSRDRSNLYAFIAGADYNLSKSSTIGLSVNGNFVNDRSKINTITSVGERANRIDSLLNSKNDQSGTRENLNYDLNYTFKDQRNRQLTTSLVYSSFSNKGNSTQPNQYFDPSGSMPLSHNAILINTKADIDIYAMKADWETPFLTGKLDVGVKFSEVGTNNNFRYFNILNNMAILNTNLSNVFDYKEHINAGYVNFGKGWKKVGLEVGLRGEQTISEGVLMPTENITTTETYRNYFDLFPNASLSYKLNEKNSVSLAAGRRIDRPNYQTLNPFEYRLSELVYQKGNPDLSPQYTQKYSLSYAYNNAFTANLTYSSTAQLLNQIIDTTGGRKIIFLPYNLGREKKLAYEMTYSIPLNDTWKTFTYVYLFRQEIDGEVPNGKLNQSINSYILYHDHNVNFSNTLSFTLAGYLIGPSYYGTFRQKVNGGLDVTLQKKILKERGVLVFNGVNVLNTSYVRNRLNFGGVRQSTVDRSENRLFKLSFLYRFNSNKISRSQHKSAAEEESKRTR